MLPIIDLEEPVVAKNADEEPQERPVAENADEEPQEQLIAENAAEEPQERPVVAENTEGRWFCAAFTMELTAEVPNTENATRTVATMTRPENSWWTMPSEVRTGAGEISLLSDPFTVLGGNRR